MRAVLQRVSSAKVDVDGETVGSIDAGLLVLLGVERGDDESDLNGVLDKTAALRIFEDDAGKMNLSVADIGGSVLVVSQFTLLADCRKGRRPGFTDAAAPEDADRYYRDFIQDMSDSGVFIKTRQKFEPGQNILMTFMSPDQQKPFKILGEIMRMLDNGIGVRFKKESQVQAEIIATLVKQIQAGEESG